MPLIKDFFNLFYPNLCTTCNQELLTKESILCSFCLHDLPTTNYINFKNNRVAKIFFGKVAIENATALLFYRKTGKVRKLIHLLKYKNRQDIGLFLGNWLGVVLKESGVFSHIDYVLPVPLHSKKKAERGYNQLTLFGKQLSKILNTTYLPNILVRTSTSPTQTFKQRFERFSNTQTKFLLTQTKLIENKNILLIDDVITTGATLQACCKELQKAKGIKISIATMAFTE